MCGAELRSPSPFSHDAALGLLAAKCGLMRSSCQGALVRNEVQLCNVGALSHTEHERQDAHATRRPQTPMPTVAVATHSPLLVG